MVTWLAVAIICLISAIAFLDLPAIIDTFGLIPAQWWRWGGATLITSFFIHGSIAHLVSNMYFLCIFGDNVEIELGWDRLIILLLLSTLGGDLFHILFDPRSLVPCVGASGGISGVLTYYALCFPHAKLAIFGWIVGWIRIPAFCMFGLWIGLQLIGLQLQLSGHSPVSALAHLGGVIVGVIFWWKTR